MDTVEPETVVQDLKGAGMNRRRHCCCISIFVFMALLLVSFAYQMSPALAAQEDKDIIAGIPANFPPQYQVDAKTGKPYGLAIDVMDEVARRSGIKVRYVVYGNFSDVTAALRKGDIDLVPNFGITDERKKYTDFTAPVETFHIHIFVRSTTNSIKNIDDLTGRKVAVVAENQGYFIMKERIGSELLVYNSMEEALMSLISGNADAMVYPEEWLLRVARQSGIEDRIKPAGEALVEIKRAIGVRKGQPELYNKLDEAVKAFILTPEYEKIYSKWYGKPEPYWNTERVLMVMGIVVVIAVAVFFVFHYFSVLRLNKKLEDSLIQLEKSGEALRESEEKYRNLVERSNDGILIIQDGVVKFINARLAELWGGSVEELLETPMIRHIHPDERDKVMERYQRRMANENVPPIYETVLLRNDGTTVQAEINAGVISYKGKPADLIMVRDITEHKRAEEELRKHRDHLEELVKERTAELNAKKDELQDRHTALLSIMEELNITTSQLEATNKELQAFSYSVSHDLRVPLRAIEGFSQALLEDYGNKLDAEGKDYLWRLWGASQKMSQLIEAMLTLSRLTRSDIKRENVDLSALAKTLAEELQRTQPDRKAVFVIAKGVTATGDAAMLRIVLDNLLGNAWKFTGKHPSARIEFGVKEIEGKPAYFVKDDGAGFDMAYADKLFSAFQRLHTEAEFPGIGIGLATVQRIIHRHGGRVWAQGEVEKGATFYFTL